MTTANRALWSWALYDWANSAYPTIIQTFVFAAYFTRQVAPNPESAAISWSLCMGLSGVILAIVAPILGAAADQGDRKKSWLFSCSLVTVTASLLLWFIYPDSKSTFLALFLVGLGTLGAEFAFIFYNAMLPELAPPHKLGRWSGWGWAMGYAGGMAVLLIAYFGFIEPSTALFATSDKSAAGVRSTFVLAGVWYALFAIPLFLWTPKEPPATLSPKQAILKGLHQLKYTWRHLKNYRTVIRFLIVRMLYVDALATLFAMGGLYAAGTFDMTEAEVMLFGIGLNVTAGIGAGGFAFLDDKMGAKRVIIIALMGLAICCAVILTVNTISLFWAAGLALGIFVGPAQASSRSYLARMAPEQVRSEAFGLFVLSGKATAFLGPFLVGLGTAATGSMRWGLSVVVLLFILGLILMLKQPADTAIQIKPLEGK